MTAQQMVAFDKFADAQQKRVENNTSKSNKA